MLTSTPCLLLLLLLLADSTASPAAAAQHAFTAHGVFHEQGIARDAAGAYWTVYDDDGWHDTDDIMTDGYADPAGNVLLSYSERAWDSAWWWWRTRVHPDIYATITGPGIMPFRTRTYPDQKRSLDMGMVQVYPDRLPTCGAGYNGCGPKGIDIVIADGEFEQVCNNHDCCYSTCGETRLGCDDEMYDLMRSYCRYGNHDDIFWCYTRAWLAYTVVRFAGNDFFLAAQSNCTHGSSTAEVARTSDAATDDDITTVILRDRVYPQDEGIAAPGAQQDVQEAQDTAFVAGIEVGLASAAVILAAATLVLVAYRTYHSRRAAAGGV